MTSCFLPWDQWADGPSIVWFAGWWLRWAWLLASTGHCVFLVQQAGLLSHPRAHWQAGCAGCGAGCLAAGLGCCWGWWYVLRHVLNANELCTADKVCYLYYFVEWLEMLVVVLGIERRPRAGSFRLQEVQADLWERWISDAAEDGLEGRRGTRLRWPGHQEPGQQVRVTVLVKVVESGNLFCCFNLSNWQVIKLKSRYKVNTQIE